MSTRRKYSKEFKDDAVRLAEISGNVSQTARDLGINAGILRRWQQRIAEDGKRAFPGHGSPRDE